MRQHHHPTDNKTMKTHLTHLTALASTIIATLAFVASATGATSAGQSSLTAWETTLSTRLGFSDHFPNTNIPSPMSATAAAIQWKVVSYTSGKPLANIQADEQATTPAGSTVVCQSNAGSMFVTPAALAGQPFAECVTYTTKQTVGAEPMRILGHPAWVTRLVTVEVLDQWADVPGVGAQLGCMYRVSLDAGAHLSTVSSGVIDNC